MDLVVHSFDVEATSRRVTRNVAAQARGDVLLGADWGIAPLGHELLVGFPVLGAAGVLPPFRAEGACRAADPRFLTFIPDVTVQRQPRLQITPCPDSQQVLFTGPADFGRVLDGWQHDQGWDLWVAAPAEGLYRGAIYLFEDAGRRPGALRNHEAADVVLEGPSPGDQLGSTLKRCPDPAGGPDLLAVGLPGWSGPASEEPVPERGAVALFQPESLAHGRWTLDDAIAFFEGGRPYARAGIALACGADLDGDGRPDLAIGASGEGGDADGAGAIYVLSGQLSTSRDLSEAAGLVLRGERPGEQLGRSLEIADLDLDGGADLIAGAPGLDTPEAPNAGGVRIFLHGALSIQQSLELYGGRNSPSDRLARLGTTLAVADLTGDERPEILAGSWRMTGSGRAFAGEIRTWHADAQGDLPTEDPSLIVGDAPHQQLGRRLITADVLEVGHHQIISTIRRRAR